MILINAYILFVYMFSLLTGSCNQTPTGQNYIILILSWMIRMLGGLFRPVILANPSKTSPFYIYQVGLWNSNIYYHLFTHNLGSIMMTTLQNPHKFNVSFVGISLTCRAWTRIASHRRQEGPLGMERCLIEIYRPGSQAKVSWVAVERRLWVFQDVGDWWIPILHGLDFEPVLGRQP